VFKITAGAGIQNKQLIFTQYVILQHDNYAYLSRIARSWSLSTDCMSSCKILSASIVLWPLQLSLLFISRCIAHLYSLFHSQINQNTTYFNNIVFMFTNQLMIQPLPPFLMRTQSRRSNATRWTGSLKKLQIHQALI
jgi:hypothetical protein